MSIDVARLTERVDWAPGLASFTLDRRLEFVPGQWVNLGLELDGELVRRSYSIASAPGQPLEFFLVRVAGGALTPALFDLSTEQELLVEDRARGFFTLDYVPRARDAWLIATGTGLGPFMSMLRSGVVQDHFETVVVVHSARRGQHLAYRAELEALVAQAPARLRYLPLVSREKLEGVLQGRVTDVLRDGRLERAADRFLEPEHAHVLLCGNPAMIEEMTALLAERGLRRHRTRKPGHITTEKYW